MNPKETVKHNYLYSVCGKKITVGIIHRIEKLADRKNGFKPKGSPPFYSIIPLEEIIAETFRVGVKSRTVKMNTYNCCKNSAAN